MHAATRSSAARRPSPLPRPRLAASALAHPSNSQPGGFAMKAFQAGLVAAALAAAPFTASAQKTLATGDVNYAGVTAEVTECKRSEGTMTVKIRLKNTGTD